MEGAAGGGSLHPRVEGWEYEKRLRSRLAIRMRSLGATVCTV